MHTHSLLVYYHLNNQSFIARVRVSLSLSLCVCVCVHLFQAHHLPLAHESAVVTSFLSSQWTSKLHRHSLTIIKSKPLTVGDIPTSSAIGVNFTNILCVAFLYKSFARSFFVLEVKVKLFIGAKKMVQLRSKMLLKLTPAGVNFTNTIRPAVNLIILFWCRLVGANLSVYGNCVIDKALIVL
jgi:hypothetical protein